MDKNLILIVATASIAIISLVFGIISLLKLNSLKKQLSVLFTGKDITNLESLIMSHSEEIGQLDKEIQELFEISNKINQLAAKSLHKFEVLRFNPFKDIGGDQSFAIALLNAKNSGIVLSSLHTREGTRIYAKPIEKGVCEKYTLTEEEKNAIASATIVKPTKI